MSVLGYSLHSACASVCVYVTSVLALSLLVTRGGGNTNNTRDHLRFKISCGGGGVWIAARKRRLFFSRPDFITHIQNKQDCRRKKTLVCVCESDCGCFIINAFEHRYLTRVDFYLLFFLGVIVFAE